jgi:hypothetical protein
VPILIEVIDTLGGEHARPTHHAVDTVPLGQQELGKVRAVLPSDARNECDFLHGLT